MKNIYIIQLAAAGLGFVSILSGCDSQPENKYPVDDQDVFLEVEVRGLNRSSRNLIEDNVLLDGSKYGLCVYNEQEGYVGGDYNVAVDYSDGKSTLSKDIMLPDYDLEVYAYYPYDKDYTSEYFINILSQTDYLWGRAEDETGHPSFVSQSHPKAFINFEHILSRITLRVHRSENNKKEYYIPSIVINADGINAYRSCFVDIISRRLYMAYEDMMKPIVGALSATTLDNDNDLIIADFLVLPTTEKSWWEIEFDFGSGEHSYCYISELKYESGKQYVYDCEIIRNEVVVISECNILQWENTDMPEIDTY